MSGRRLGLLAGAAALLSWNLGGYGLWESTEARYASVAAAMVRSGDWLVPRLDGIAHFDKPPVAYWLTAAGMEVLGVGETGARIGLVLAAVAALAVVHGWIRETRGPRAAGFAALALLSAPLFFALSRSVSTDLYLTLWIVIAADAGRRGSRPGGGRGWRLVAWAALGAGFMTKGPVVLVWTALPALTWAAWTGRWRRLARLLDPWGVAAGLAVALPWYALEAARHPGLAGYWLGGQTAGRMAAPYEGEAEPAWTYLVVAAWAAGPWIATAVAELVRRPLRTRPERAWWVAWATVPLIAFSLFPTKRPNYLLPLVVPLAMAAGAWWAAAGEGRRGTAAARIAALLAGVLGAGLVGAALMAADRLPAPLPALGLFLGPAFLLGAGAAWAAAGRRRADLAFAGVLLPLLGLYVAGYTALGRPAIEAWFKISRPLARVVEAHRLDAEPVVAWRDWPRAFPFYLDQRIVTVETGERAAVFEPDSEWTRWIRLDPEAIARIWRSPERTFVFLPRAERGALEARVGGPIPVLGETRRYLVTVNHPTSAETRSPARRPTSRIPSGGPRSGPSAP